MASSCVSAAGCFRFLTGSVLGRAIGLSPALLLIVGSGCSSDPGAGQNSQTQTTRPVTCGNFQLDPGEACDGTQFAFQVTCDFATGSTRPQGTVSCNPDCVLDTNTCFPGPPVGGSTGAGGFTSSTGGYPLSTGGYTSSGGYTAAGGLPNTGGDQGAGGFGVGSGGDQGAGGFVSTGGDQGAGGFVSTGGDQGAGGAVNTGGTVSTGGLSGTGGSIGSEAPTVPAVSQTCPNFVNSTITFMGLGGIQIVAGSKPPGPTAPMVFYWHGTGSTAGEFGFMAAAVRDGVVQEGGVLVSFQGTTGGDLWSGTSIFGKGDLNLTDQLYACAVKDHNVDPRRVFVTGCSAGGLFSGAMAAARSSYVAAAAPNSGGWVAPVPWQNSHTPALMTIHGAPGSDVVVIDFSQSSATADNAFKSHGGFVINCNHGGGHCGGSGQAPSIWQFFKSHPYGVSPEPYAGGLPAGFSSVCKIF